MKDNEFKYLDGCYVPCAGVSIGLTYGKTLGESVQIGTLLAASVITSSENVCPRFQPAELGLDVQIED